MVKRRRSLRLFGAAFMWALGSVACVSVLGLEKLSEKAASTDAGTDSSVDASGACATDSIDAALKPSPQPAGENPRYFAFNQLDLAITPELGFDLDHQVTTDRATNSCVYPDGGDGRTDSPTGVDNAAAGLFPTVAVLAPALSAMAVNERLRAGFFGMLMGIGGWNGTPNDDSITVLLFPTLGIWNILAGGGRVPGGPSNPNRLGVVGDGDASDQWMRDERFPLGTASTAIEAWVTNGKLVARFDTLTLPIRSDFDLKLIDILLRDGWLTADLSAGAGDPRSATLSNGVIAGRLVVPDFLAQLLLLQTGTKYLCAQAGLPDLAIKTVCSFRDIRTSHCEDHQGLPCDALSVGAHFETYAVDALGPLYTQTDDVYRDAGLLPPAERCLDVGFDGAVACPQ